MATDPITSARYPDESDSGDVALWMRRGVNDLSTVSVPRFTTTTARDNAYTAAITAGTITSIADGWRCSVNGVPYRRINGSWRVDRIRNFQRVMTGAGAISSGGANETGLTSGVNLTPSNTFTLYEASTVSVKAEFRAGPNPGNTAVAAQCTVRVNGSTVGNIGISRLDMSIPVIATVALAAGTHTVSMRVDAIGGAVSWVDGIVTISDGSAE